MKYTYLKAFYVVCKHQNISKAAAELEVSQPALSRIIATLEEECGVQLLYRHKGGVRLTKDGTILYNQITGPIKELEKIEDNFLNKNLFKRTIVKIGITAMALECYLFKYLDKLKNTFPLVNFQITTGSSQFVTKKVEEKEIDFAFITSPYKLNNELELINVYQINNILIAPKSYEEKLKGITSLKQLEKFPFILLDKKMQFREQLNYYFESNGINIKAVYEPDSSNLLLKFVENDCGLTFVPEDMAKPSIISNKIIEVKIKEQLPPRYVSFIYRKDQWQSEIIQRIKREIFEDIKK